MHRYIASVPGLHGTYSSSSFQATHPASEGNSILSINETKRSRDSRTATVSLLVSSMAGCALHNGGQIESC